MQSETTDFATDTATALYEKNEQHDVIHKTGSMYVLSLIHI